MFINPTLQGWMFLPLVDYHGGGEEAQFEPLIDNIKVKDSSGRIHNTNSCFLRNLKSLKWLISGGL